MEPYRSNDPRDLEAFVQHVSIADGLVEELVPKLKRFESEMRYVEYKPSRPSLFTPLLDGARERSRQDARSAVGPSWEAIWDQLEEARMIVALNGRSVTAFDEARARGGDLTSNAASFEAGTYRPGFTHYTSTMAYNLPPLEAARDAIVALRAAVPEVVVPKAPPAKPYNGTLHALRRTMMYLLLATALGLIVLLVR